MMLARAAALVAVLAAPSDPHVVVSRAYDAFNAHDAGRFVAHVAENVSWFTVSARGVTTELLGREALRRYLIGYFQKLPSVRSRIESTVGVGPHVAIHERVAWMTSQGERTAAALAVYEVEYGRIVRVWYYEARR